MARRSINNNKRKSSVRLNNASGILNDDTNVYDNDDPQWFESSAVRPSTSIRVLRYQSAVLNPDSTVETSELPSQWYKKLPRSDSSIAIEKLLKNKEKDLPVKDKAKSSEANEATESDSDNEPRLKRPKFIQNKNKIVDESNAFLKALEKTTEARTKTIISNTHMDGSESESTNNDSKTVKKLRPLSVRPKTATSVEPSSYEDTICSDASEKIQMNFENLRLRRRTINQLTSTPEVTNKIQNLIKNKEAVVLLSTELRNKSNKMTLTKNTSKRPNASEVEPANKKKKNQTKDQAEETGATANSFAAALDTRDDDTNESHIDKTQKNKGVDSRSDTVLINEDTENSTIPVNIRRTRSRSMFQAKESRDSSAEKVDNTNSRSTRSKKSLYDQDQEKNEFEKTSQVINKSTNISMRQHKSQNKSVVEKTNVNASNTSINVSKDKSHKNKSSKNITKHFQTSILQSSSSSDEENVDETLRNISNKISTSRSSASVKSTTMTHSKNLSFTNKSHSIQKILNVSKIDGSSSDEEINVVDEPNYKNILTNIRKSSSDKENNTGTNKSKKSQSNTSQVSPFKKPSDTLKNNSIQNESVGSPAITKSRSRLFKRKANEKSNTLDQTSYSDDHSKTSKRDESVILPRRSPRVKSNISQNLFESIDKTKRTLTFDLLEKNKSVTHDSAKLNSQEDVTEGENSTIPQYIRRTKSRLFEQSKNQEDDNPYNEALNDERVPHRDKSVDKNKSKKQNESLASKSTINSISMTRDDFCKRKHETIKPPHAVLPNLPQHNLSRNLLNDSSNHNKSTHSVNKSKSTMAIAMSPRAESLEEHPITAANLESNNRDIEKSSQGKSLNKESSNVRKSKSHSQNNDADIEKSSRGKSLNKESSNVRKSKSHSKSNADIEKSPRGESLSEESNTVRKSQSYSQSNDADIEKSPQGESLHEESSNARKSKLYSENSNVDIERSPRGESLHEESSNARKSKSLSENSNFDVERSPRGESLHEESSNASKSKSNAQNREKSKGRSVEIFNNEPSESVKDTPNQTNRSIPSNKASNRSLPPNQVNHTILSNQTDNLDDLLHTPNPAQSTLMPTGKPVKRITDFFALRKTMSKENDSVLKETINNKSKTKVQQSTSKNKSKDKSVSTQDDDDSEVSDYPMLTRQLNDIPYENEKSTYQEDEAPPEKSKQYSIPPSLQKSVRAEDLDAKGWAEAFERVRQRQKQIEALRMREQEIRREEELKKANLDARVKKVMAKKAAEKKKAEKAKQPINPAYLFNGKVYKPPKLPRPKKWVTDKLYKHLWKCMEPTYGLRTRVKSEKFITKFSEIYDHIIKKKKYNDYEAELNELIVYLAKLNVIKDRSDYFRFCHEFMPHDFIMKTVPMTLPGNEQNIPFDPETIYCPIISEDEEE